MDDIQRLQNYINKLTHLSEAYNQGELSDKEFILRVKHQVTLAVILTGME